jgi:solute:Na+ symporter, SSS family
MQRCFRLRPEKAENRDHLGLALPLDPAPSAAGASMIDLLIVLSLVAYTVTYGFLARKKASKGLEEQFLTGKTLTGWQPETRMAGTQLAADTPLWVSRLIATVGVFAVWRLRIYGRAFLMMAFILALRWREAGVLTGAELTEIR